MHIIIFSIQIITLFWSNISICSSVCKPNIQINFPHLWIFSFSSMEQMQYLQDCWMRIKCENMKRSQNKDRKLLFSCTWTFGIAGNICTSCSIIISYLTMIYGLGYNRPLWPNQQTMIKSIQSLEQCMHCANGPDSGLVLCLLADPLKPIRCA